MRQELGRAGVEFERVAGVDGAALGAEVLAAFREARTPAKPEGWLPGEVGCFLSHFEIWRRIALSDDDWAAVLEDDLSVSPELGPLLCSSDWIPASADIVRLEANRSMRLSEGVAIAATPGRRIFRALSGTSGSAGYIMAKRIAAWLVETSPARHASVDVFLFKPKASSVASKLRRYQVVPAVCVQDGVLDAGNAALASLIKPRNTRGRGYRAVSNPFLRLWPIRRYAVPFRR